MARMTRMIISIPADEKRWLDGYGKRHRISSAEAVRLAVREFRQKKTEKGLGGVLDRTAGKWKSIRGETGEYVDNLRSEWERTPEANAEADAVKEERSPYGPPLPADITDQEELRRRAIAAAGRFESGAPDLSIRHDSYLADERTEGGTENGSSGVKAGAGSKKGGGPG